MSSSTVETSISLLSCPYYDNVIFISQSNYNTIRMIYILIILYMCRAIIEIYVDHKVKFVHDYYVLELLL